MTGFDACTAIPPELVTQLGVEKGRPTLDRQRGVPGCLWLRIESEPRESYYIDSSDRLDLSQVNLISERFKIGRYDAAVGKNPAVPLETACQVFIGIKPMQVLQVKYEYTGRTEPMNHDLACKKAIPLAETVIASLEQRGGR